MIVNADITLYHLDEDRGGYLRQYFPQCHIYNVCAAKNDKTGLSDDSLCKIRIYTRDEIAVDAGDYVFVGCGSELPDKEKCRAVSSFCDNRGSVQPHWRVFCE